VGVNVMQCLGTIDPVTGATDVTCSTVLIEQAITSSTYAVVESTNELWLLLSVQLVLSCGLLAFFMLWRR